MSPPTSYENVYLDGEGSGGAGAAGQRQQGGGAQSESGSAYTFCDDIVRHNVPERLYYSP